MTENEAMKNLETLERFYRIAKSGSALHEVLINFVTLEDLVVAIQSLSEIQQYRAIGTIEEFKALKEKNTPMKHHHTRIDNISDEIRVSVCPNCLSIMYTHSEEYPVFCNACGQKLDWE